MFTDASRGHKTFTSCINQVLLFTLGTTVVCTSTITVYLAPHKISTVLNTSNDQAQCYIILYWACYYSKLSGLREVEEVGRGMGGGGLGRGGDGGATFRHVGRYYTYIQFFKSIRTDLRQ